MLNFNDGVSIDTSGPLRCVSLHDGLYVVGDGMCIPVADGKEASETISKIQANKEQHGMTDEKGLNTP